VAKSAIVDCLVHLLLLGCIAVLRRCGLSLQTA